MRLTFKYNYRSDEPRPIFKIAINEEPIYCMIDTGAIYPVYANNHFKDIFPQARRLGDYRLSGFGGSGETVELYKIGNFRLDDNCGNFIVYHNLHVLYSPKIKDVHIILSASMFQYMRYLLSPTEGLIVIDSPFNTYKTTFDTVSRQFRIYGGCNVNYNQSG